MMKLSQQFSYSLFLFSLVSFIPKSYAQADSFTSHLYFPGSIGINIPLGNAKLKSGLMISTAAEYRPDDQDGLFFRFNYDVINSHYTGIQTKLPTNVNTGKFSESTFVTGAGYRKKIGRVSIFGLLQPGLGINSFEHVKIDGSNISISQITNHHLIIKVTPGIEYYLAEHFALTFEPSYFYVSPNKTYHVPNPQNINFSIGFTTTLF